MVSKRPPSPTKPSHKARSLQKVRSFEPSIGIPVEHTAQLTIFRAESAPKVSAVFVVGSAHLHLPNRVAKHLRHKSYVFWNLLPEHRSSSITNSMGMSLKTHIRRSTEQRRTEIEKVHGRIASYRTAPRTWSTKACMQRLPEKIQLKN